MSSSRRRRLRSRRRRLKHFKRRKTEAVTVASHLLAAVVVQIKETWRIKVIVKRSLNRMILRAKVRKSPRIVVANRLHMKVDKAVNHLVVLKAQAALMGKAQTKSGRMNRVRIVPKLDKYYNSFISNLKINKNVYLRKLSDTI